MSVKQSYPDGVCPDCGEPIPDDMPEYGTCENCEHVLFSQPKDELFKVVAISENANSFGLSGVVVMTKDGRAWEIGVSRYSGEARLLSKGDVIKGVTFKGDIRQGFPFQFEIPRRLPDPPKEVIEQVWRDEYGLLG